MATSHDLPGKKPATKTTTTLTVKKTPAKKVATPAATKATVAKVPVAKTSSSKVAETSKTSPAQKPEINAPVANASVSPEERYKMIAAAAYSKAEHRGFASGYALNDWIAAEKEIDRMLEAQALAPA